MFLSGGWFPFFRIILAQQQTEKFSKVIAPAAAVAAMGETYKPFLSVYLFFIYRVDRKQCR